MLLDAALAYAHFVAVFLVFGTLSAEAFIVRLPANAATLRLLARVDLLFGISAGLAVAAGLARVYFGAKGAAYYWAEPFFWAKMAAFAIVGLISIVPTLRFIRWRKAAAADGAFVAPEADMKAVRRLIMIELHLFALIPLFAVLMARGIGL